MVKELLRKLSNAHGVSGCEGSVVAVIKKELKGHVDEMHEDPLGNLIAVKKGGKFKVMLAAHMDEIGLIVKHIDDRGFILLDGVLATLTCEKHTSFEAGDHTIFVGRIVGGHVAPGRPLLYYRGGYLTAGMP